MADLSVNYEALSAAADLWREQSYAVRSAAETVANASPAGFDPEVRPAVDGFLATWSRVTEDIAARAERTASALATNQQEYVTHELGITRDLDTTSDVES